MSNILLVPVHLDALVLDHDQMVVESTADFSRLPFCTGKRDINPDIPNISEEIVSTPFQNENLLLKKGIHLHWSLPDALTRARPDPANPGTQDFPRVPNRWLVTRCNKNGVFEKEWLIESDFLFPTLDGNLAGTGVPIPFRKDQRQPFRYMGRRMQLADTTRDQGEYYPKLTAVGYGEPAFAAFYPNCHSVFGFHDDEYAGTKDERQYYVTGWYSDIQHDVLTTHVRDVLLFQPSDFTNLRELAVKLKAHSGPINSFIYYRLFAETRRRLDSYTGSGDPSAELQEFLIDDLNRILTSGPDVYARDRWAVAKLKPETIVLAEKRLPGFDSVYVNRKLMEEAFPDEIAPRSPTLPSILKDRFKWEFAQSDTVEFPIRMVCYARLTLGQPVLRAPHGPTTISIGNTGTEALSANLAPKLNSNAPRRKIEDHLEALHLAPTLEHRQLDVAAKFVEGRHEKGFTAVSGGSLWTVQAESDANAPAEARATPGAITLPDRLGRLLNTLNKCQSDYDRAWQMIESLRIQLFSDWYKYMLCAYPPPGTREAYPDIDKVAAYIEFRRLSLNKQIDDAGTVALNESGGEVLAEVTSGSSDSTARKLAAAINELQVVLGSLNRKPGYKLKQTSGPRYWRPTEPSILIDGTKADPSKRHGQDGRPSDGLLETQTFSSTPELTKQNLDRIRQGIAALPNRDQIFAFKKWDGQPWNPFLLEWEVEVFPVEHKSNIDPATGRYQKDFITANYRLVENDVDLSLRPGRGAWTMAANVYSGRSILTPHATQQLGKQAQSYIQKQVLPEFYKARDGLLRSKQDNDDPVSVIKAAWEWYETSTKSPLLRATNRNEDATMTAFRAWGAMTDPENEPDCLSQSLSGFNDALLMHKQTLQLHVADPLGFEEYQQFAKGLGDTISNSIYNAPVPHNDFNPIRSGMMKIHRLRIIDTFGQIEELDVNQIMPSESLDDGTEDPLINLPPRLTQPARVNFRWLSAEADQEMNDHPATTPICGWVLSNNLDDSLMIYDNAGKALGSLVKKDAGTGWQPAPGGHGISSVSEIRNRHLHKMVTTIQSLGAAFLSDFVTAIDSAVENIEPENFARHQDLALLMGRPLALVRASVNLEVKGLPATHQGWNEFRQDIESDKRDDNGFTDVRFGIRIGEYRQFNDGTVGYWKEKKGEYEGKVFYAPQSDEDVKFKGDYLKTHRTDPEAMVFYHTVAEPEPQILSLLIDPRGLVHATTGILPVKAINIPPDQYAAALQAIEITFLSTPILTDTGKIHLPLPEEAGYHWSWLQKNFENEWSEISQRGLVQKQTFVDAFKDDAETIWKDLKKREWIELLDEKDDTCASVIAKDHRGNRSLSAEVKDHTDKIEDILDRAHIGPVNPSARFSGPQEIREGWLKLSPAAQQPAK